MRYEDHRIPIRVPTSAPPRWPRRVKARRRCLRAFLAWHAANRSRFAIPLELLERRDTHLTLGFHGIVRELTAIVSQDEINVAFDWEGTW